MSAKQRQKVGTVGRSATKEDGESASGMLHERKGWLAD
jgi:hypothetical protein